jgi:hypothetical protein
MGDSDLSSQEDTRGVRHRVEVAVSRAMASGPRELCFPEPRAFKDRSDFKGCDCRGVESDGLARGQNSRGKCHRIGVAGH